MILLKIIKNKKGFTLIEVLLSITILSVVTIGMLSLFTQAYSYTKMNENRTVALNVARNALIYMERQDFDFIKNLISHTSITYKEICTSLDSNNRRACEAVLKPTINNIVYDNIEISLYEYNKENVPEKEKIQLNGYLVGITVTVDVNPPIVIEGVITDESIR